MTNESCKCSICMDRSINMDGIVLAEKEVIPFVKINLLKAKYPSHPLPMKYNDSLSALFSYSQALAHDRAHDLKNRKYFTGDKLLLKFKDELNAQFSTMVICDKKEMASNEDVQLVCEFNCEK